MQLFEVNEFNVLSALGWVRRKITIRIESIMDAN